MNRHTQQPGYSPLLQTKLHFPVIHSAVFRANLLTKLNSALEKKLVLISAPAGFGKTTLAANWLSEVGSTSTYPVRCAWLSLDENDNDLPRFLSYLIAAFQKIDSHIGRGLQEALYTPEWVDVEAIVTALLNDLVAAGEEFSQQHNIVLLDDYHVLDNPDIDAALVFLCDHLPDHLHLVILSRIAPALPLARLRARRQIIEIRERDLRFSVDEARSFFNDIMHLPLQDADIHLLQSRTEGWIAGLQLAALAMQGAENQLVAEFSGTHRYILDYLTDEVFQRQGPDIQRFLLETSLLNRMCAALCDSVRGENDSQNMLERLERANLFIVPLDQQRHWYRYHHLFADLLRQRLRQTMPEAAVRLHERASAWYARFAAESGDEAAIDEALHHAISGQDYRQAAALLEQFGDGVWERGQHDRLRRWLSLVPVDLIDAHPTLNILLGWLSFSAGQYAEAEAYLNRAAAVLDEQKKTAELRGRIAAVRAFIATFRGDSRATVQWAETALKLLSPHSKWRSSAAIALGDAHSLSGDTLRGSAVYQEALHASHDEGNIYLALNASFKLAASQRQRGLLREAYAICSEQIALAEKSGLAQTVMAGCLYALRGDILCEWNQVAEGLAQTQQAIETSAHTRHIGFAGWITLYRTRCLMAARQFDKAAAALDDMDRLAEQTPLPPWLVSPLMALRVLLWLAGGETERAAAWVSDTKLSPNDEQMAGREFEYLTYARLLAMGGQPDAAQRILARLLEITRQQGRASISLIILLLQALLFQAQGKQDAALKAVAEALLIGEKGGFARSFMDMGGPLLPLQKTAAAQGITPDYTHYLLTQLTTPPVPQIPKPDALSERELEVIRLIAAGLKNQDIADQLVISLNTVLYHTKNIYSKLNVTHRTQAVQRARELDLL